MNIHSRTQITCGRFLLQNPNTKRKTSPCSETIHFVLPTNWCWTPFHLHANTVKTKILFNSSSRPSGDADAVKHCYSLETHNFSTDLLKISTKISWDCRIPQEIAKVRSFPPITQLYDQNACCITSSTLREQFKMVSQLNRDFQAEVCSQEIASDSKNGAFHFWSPLHKNDLPHSSAATRSDSFRASHPLRNTAFMGGEFLSPL